MADLWKRIPKKGDHVNSPPLNGTFIVVQVNTNPRVVDLQPLKGTKEMKAIEAGIPWSKLVFLDEEDASQAAARTVREATE